MRILYWFKCFSSTSAWPSLWSIVRIVFEANFQKHNQINEWMFTTSIFFIKRNILQQLLIFTSFYLQWNHLFTGAMSKNPALSLVLDLLCFWPCPASPSSASLPICPCSHCSAQLHSESTKLWCKPFKRPAKDILSSKSSRILAYKAKSLKNQKICSRCLNFET